jgi:ribonuclease HI
VKCITVNTDASFHPQLKVGGYAFYIVCDLFKIQKAGQFKRQPRTPMEAEMMCMANALHTLLSQPELPAARLIVINSDCLYSFEKISRKSNDAIGRTVASILREVRKKTSFRDVVMPQFEFRHVKAHTTATDARSHVNRWCDMEAKRWMRHAAAQAAKQASEVQTSNTQ